MEHLLKKASGSMDAEHTGWLIAAPRTDVEASASSPGFHEVNP
jgi:hypothetical protein